MGNAFFFLFLFLFSQTRERNNLKKTESFQARFERYLTLVIMFVLDTNARRIFYASSVDKRSLNSSLIMEH